jgi:hypothetical protein
MGSYKLNYGLAREKIFFSSVYMRAHRKVLLKEAFRIEG